jgi:hypothetical protein
MNQIVELSDRTWYRKTAEERVGYLYGSGPGECLSRVTIQSGKDCLSGRYAEATVDSLRCLRCLVSWSLRMSSSLFSFCWEVSIHMNKLLLGLGVLRRRPASLAPVRSRGGESECQYNPIVCT